MYRIAILWLLMAAVIVCEAVPLEKVLEVPEGQTVKLSCESSDNNHTFVFWELASKDIIGPANDYDANKYEYDVLSGRLYVRHISPDQEGTYTCFSKAIDPPGEVIARSVRMIVSRDWALHDYPDTNTLNPIGVVILVGCILIVIGGSYLFYIKWTKQHRLQHLLEEDEEDSGEEIFAAPGTSKGSGKIIIDRTSSRDDSLSTDFVSILSSGNNK